MLHFPLSTKLVTPSSSAGKAGSQGEKPDGCGSRKLHDPEIIAQIKVGANSIAQRRYKDSPVREACYTRKLVLRIGKITSRRGSAMQRVIEYVGEILPDGHLFVPEEIRQVLVSAACAQFQVTITLHQAEAEQVQAAWEAFRQLGQDAVPGHLPDAAVSHDQYLYRKER